MRFQFKDLSYNLSDSQDDEYCNFSICRPCTFVPCSAASCTCTLNPFTYGVDAKVQENTTAVLLAQLQQELGAAQTSGHLALRA